MVTVENSTQITYSTVRSQANTIKECSTVMQNIFSDFERSMQNIGSPDVFAGDASESLESRFGKLKMRFNDYIKLVNDFSAMIEGAASETEATEQSIQNDTTNLEA